MGQWVDGDGREMFKVKNIFLIKNSDFLLLLNKLMVVVGGLRVDNGWGDFCRSQKNFVEYFRSFGLR